MSTEVSDLQQQAIADQEAILGSETVIYRGWHVPCHGTGINRTEDYDSGGKIEILQATIFIRTNARRVRTVDANEGWTADSDEPTADEDLLPPVKGKLAIYKNRKLRIANVTVDSAGSAWRCQLVSPKSK